MAVEKPTEQPQTILGEYAGFVTRLIAWLIDRIIIVSIISILSAVATFILNNVALVQRMNELLGIEDIMVLVVTAIVVVVSITLIILYDIGLPVLAGQTLGKFVMGVRIVRTNGERLTVRSAIVRYLGYLVSFILLLGFLWVLWDNRRQGWHDKLARTFVVYTWPEEELKGTFTRDKVQAWRHRRKRRQSAEVQ